MSRKEQSSPDDAFTVDDNAPMRTRSSARNSRTATVTGSSGTQMPAPSSSRQPRKTQSTAAKTSSRNRPPGHVREAGRQVQDWADQLDTHDARTDAYRQSNEKNTRTQQSAQQLATPRTSLEARMSQMALTPSKKKNPSHSLVRNSENELSVPIVHPSTYSMLVQDEAIPGPSTARPTSAEPTRVLPLTPAVSRKLCTTYSPRVAVSKPRPANCCLGPPARRSDPGVNTGQSRPDIKLNRKRESPTSIELQQQIGSPCTLR